MRCHFSSGMEKLALIDLKCVPIRLSDICFISKMKLVKKLDPLFTYNLSYLVVFLMPFSIKRTYQTFSSENRQIVTDLKSQDISGRSRAGVSFCTVFILCV